MREPWKSPGEKKAFISVSTNDSQVAMKGKYGLLAGLTSIFLLFGGSGCETKEKEPEEPRPAYHVVEMGNNEYSVLSSEDPPPKVTIETEPWGNSTGTAATLYVSVVDNKAGNSGIKEVAVWEDCELIKIYELDGKIRKFGEDIKVYHFDEGVRSYEVIATDMARQESRAYTNIYFSGEINDLPPRIQNFVFDESGFDFNIYDPGERSGIREVTLLEDDKPLHVWENPTFSGAGVSIPDGRVGIHKYQLEATDIGGHTTSSDIITLNYGRGAPRD